MPKKGDKAPELQLPDQEGVVHTLSQYRGKWVLLYFYPKDDTPGCTKEACAIRDTMPQVSSAQLVVLGVSADSVESHKKFAEKYELPFTLLADKNKECISAYGVTRRSSFLINPEGLIIKVYESVKPELHIEEVLRDLEEYKK